MAAVQLLSPPALAASNSSTYVTMPDGVRIAVDVWLPGLLNEEVGIPAIVEFTRYWRATAMDPPSDNLTEARRQSLAAGFAFVAVDVRGTGASFGSRGAEFSLAEARDMPHVIDWIAAQPWSNGQVASMGISYDGNTAEMASLYRSPALMATVPRFTDFDWYTSIVIPGGLKNAYITERWAAGAKALDRNDVTILGDLRDSGDAENPKVLGVKPVDDDTDQRLLKQATQEHAANQSLADSLNKLVYRDQYPSAPDLDADGDMAVSIHNFEAAFEKSPVPAYHWGSWFDAGTAAGVLARFQSFDVPAKYVIGAWSHGANFDANPYKPEDSPVDPSLDEQFQDIFEFVRGQMTEGADSPAKELSYYTVGENAWKTTDVWPPRGHRLERWWFDADGVLSVTPPEAVVGSDRYAVDFSAGTGPTSRWSTQLGGGDVFYEDRSVADTKLLTYTSAPLEHAVELTGTALVTVQVSSTHEDGALIVYLEDVDQTGHVRMLTEGQLRLRHRSTRGAIDSDFGPARSFTEKDGRLLTPGETTTVELALLPVSARIDAGHAIRIAIAGHDQDTFLRVPVVGDPVMTFERNVERMSYIDLPVIESSAPTAPDPVKVEAWADALFTEALERKRMSGAVLTMVQRGKTVLSKGYGFSDYRTGTPVDPEETRFRIGSTTKTFTALAIAQLMDQGRIESLDDPANRYLKRLQLPSPDGRDITLKHLLTHTAGFENRVYNIGTDRLYELPLSAEEIKRYEPSVVSPPGEYSSYNNYGTTMLGLIVEDVTGQRIDEYFNDHIFTPLGMTRSVLNMSPEPTEGLGTSYGFLPNGDAAEIPHRTVHPFFAPVGGINATGNDMARYMLAQLDAGRSDDAILSPATFRTMHSQIRSNHPLSSGFGMIYFTFNWDGLDAVIHGGDWPGTHSGMVLLPQLDTAFFFSLLAEYPEVPLLESITGSERTTPSPDVVVDTPLSNLGVLFNFRETFFGLPEPPHISEASTTDLEEYVGNYVGRSAAFSTMERMLSLTNPFNVVSVSIDDSASGLMINGKGPYAAIGPDVFWSDSHREVPLDGLFLDSPSFSFARDDAGDISYLVPRVGFDVWVKSGPLQNPQTYGKAWIILLMLALTALIAVFYPRISGRPWAKWLPLMVLIGLVAQPLVLLLGYAPGTTLTDALFFGHGGRFTLFAILANLIALLALVFGWYVVLAWRESFWSQARLGAVLRCHYTILGVGALLFIPVFAFLNLLGP
ncbi:MAG: CocE/NonD family hydrolase [Pseudomonadota bacterium]